jgi:hypothetical protein
MANKTIRLGYEPRAWQRKCHLERRRFTVLALHRRAGKTELALMELLHRAVKCQSDLGFFVYLAPFLKQAKAIAWARLKQKIDPFIRTGSVDVNEADLAVTFKSNKATIRLFGGDNPDALRGVRLDGCVIDEVAQIKPEVWEAIIQPALSDRRGWALFIGTPAGINLFSELYYRAASGSLEDWYAAKYTVYDTDALAPDEVKRLERDMPEAAFAREYLCDFSAAGDDQLIALADAENAAQRQYQDGDIIDQPLIVGVDPARFGDDRSVIVLRQGLRMEPPIVHHGIDNMALAAAIANVIEDRDPDAVFIDAGAGAGVIDRLRQLGYDVTEVPFGGKATYANLFVNKRTEMWWAIREWIQAGGSIPNDITLKQEISTPIYWYDAAGKRVLESKDEIKKRLQGGGSPDMADALCLTFAYPVAKMLPREVREKIDTRPTDYDPYEEISTRNR